MKTIQSTNERAFCPKCGKNLTELGNFTYTGSTINDIQKKDEICQCKECGEKFILQYQFFNEKGHINSFVFNGDINDPSYNWQDSLTLEQKQNIAAHLKTCKTCQQKMNEEFLSDAWLASVLHKK